MADYVDPNPNIAECSRKHRDYIKLVKPEINAAVGLLQSLEENEQDRFDLVMDEVSYTYPEDPIPRPKFNSGIFNRRLEHYDRQIFANRRYLRQTMRSVLEILEPMLSDEEDFNDEMDAKDEARREEDRRHAALHEAAKKVC